MCTNKQISHSAGGLQSTQERLFCNSSMVFSSVSMFVCVWGCLQSDIFICMRALHVLEQVQERYIFDMPFRTTLALKRKTENDAVHRKKQHTHNARSATTHTHTHHRYRGYNYSAENTLVEHTREHVVIFYTIVFVYWLVYCIHM